jgi:hypothetical protein
MNYAKKRLPLILENEWFRGLVIAFLMIGGALVLYGVYQFVDATVQIQSNVSYQRESAGITETPPASQAEAQMLMAGDVQYRSLRIQRSNALVYGGVGLAVVALGWLGYDFARSQRRKRQSVMPSQSSAG